MRMLATSGVVVNVHLVLDHLWPLVQRSARERLILGVFVDAANIQILSSQRRPSYAIHSNFRKLVSHIYKKKEKSSIKNSDHQTSKLKPFADS